MIKEILKLNIGRFSPITRHMANGKVSFLGKLKDQFGGDEAIAVEVAETFLQQVPSALEDLKKAVQIGDRPAVRFAGHKLSGMLKNFLEDERLQDLEKLELKSMALRTSEMRLLFGNVSTLCQDLAAEVRRELQVRECAA